MKKYQSFVKLKLDLLSISLDSPEKMHDRVQGVKGTYAGSARVFKNLKNTRTDVDIKSPGVSHVHSAGTITGLGVCRTWRGHSDSKTFALFLIIMFLKSRDLLMKN